jgi:hypothetical protein
MPVALPLRGVFVASAAAVACFACLLTLLKSVLPSECGGAAGGSLRAVSIACVVVAAVAIVASAAHLLQSRALSWAVAAAICSKWQPLYFAFVTLQGLVLRVIVTHAIIYDLEVSNACDEHENAVHAISWMWLCAITTTALSTMSCDINAEVSPALRRCAYGLLALVLLLDAIGSMVWRNALANDVKFSFVNINIILDSQLTSCIISQAVIALHFLYVSCRSRRGRGWAYASLRFELDECGRSSLSMPMLPTTANCGKDVKDSGRAASAATPMLASEQSAPAESQRAGAAASSVLSRLRVRWLRFQQRQVSRCRVSVIPCEAVRDAGGGGGGFALARPVFDMIWLQPLQRLADAHPRFYVGFMVLFLAVPGYACYIIFRNRTEDRGISYLVFMLLVCVMMLGFLSCKRYGLDRVAAKHVALSFRFAVIVVLLATDVALAARRVYTIDRHPTEAVALVFAGLFFCLCMLLDCSPHLPPSAQIFVSVNAHNVACHRVCLLSSSAGRMVHVLRL